MSKVICPEPGSQLTIGSITFEPQAIPSTAPGRFTPTQSDKIIDIARAAICALGSFDRGLQDHYQRQLNVALGMPLTSKDRQP